MNLRNLALLVLSSFLVGLSAEGADTLPPCTGMGEECTIVATPGDWPDSIAGEMVAVITRRYTIQIPASPAQVVSSESPWLLAIRYRESGRSIAMVNNKRDEALFSHLPKALTLADYLRYAYTTTPDRKPDNLADPEAWDIAVSARSVLFSKVTSAKVFARGPITVYYVQRTEPRPSDQSVYVVNSRRPDEFLTIDFKNFQPTETLGIVGSITTRD